MEIDYRVLLGLPNQGHKINIGRTNVIPIY